MLAERAMSKVNRRFQWSLIKYDLKTGLDILKLPCTVKVADNISGKTFEQNPTCDVTHSCTIKFEKELRVCFVRARVLELTDVKWFVKKKGEEFVRSYSLMADTEILIPLEYDGKVRLYERVGGQKYFSIREVIEDFPRFIRVERDTVCASPGIQAAQVVEKGTILELDRVTKSMQAVRGSRETYLICKDRENSRELAFRQMAPVNFIKVPDMKKHCLKDFIERLPLPQTVEFVNVNPYDIKSVDDDDARDLLVMLSGSVELLGLQMENFIVGRVDDVDTNICDIIAVPAKENVLESLFVHIPVINIDDKRRTNSYDGDYVDLAVTDDGIYSCVQQKLFLRYADDDTPLVLRADNSESFNYEVKELPDTPPIPEKLGEFSLKHTLSAPDCSAEQERPRDIRIRRRRVVSANDIERGSTVNQRTEREERGLKPFLSQLSRKMKSTASQILFGIEAFSGSVDRDLEHGGKMPSATRKGITPCDVKDNKTGFVCYLDCDLKTGKSFEGEEPVKDTAGSENVKKNEVIYASVDVLKKNKNPLQVTQLCPICKESTNRTFFAYTNA